MLTGKQRSRLRAMANGYDTIFQIGKGGITEEGTKVIYDMFPSAADEMFNKTLEKRRLTAEKAAASFEK